MSRIILLTVTLACVFTVASVAVDAQCYRECLITYQAAVTACSPGDAQCYVTAEEQYTICSSKCGPGASTQQSPISPFVTVRDSNQCLADCQSVEQTAIAACGADFGCRNTVIHQYITCTQACYAVDSKHEIAVNEEVDTTSGAGSVTDYPQCMQTCYAEYMEAYNACGGSDWSCHQEVMTTYYTCMQGCHDTAGVQKKKNRSHSIMKKKLQHRKAATHSRRHHATAVSPSSSSSSAFINPACYQACFNTYQAAGAACEGNQSCLIAAGQAYVTCQATC